MIQFLDFVEGKEKKKQGREEAHSYNWVLAASEIKRNEWKA